MYCVSIWLFFFIFRVIYKTALFSNVNSKLLLGLTFYSVMMIGYLSSFGSLTDFLHLMDILLNGKLVECSVPVKFVHCEVGTKVH